MARTQAATRWSRLIDQHESSGLTIGAFAKKHGLNAHSLAKWRSRLGRTRPYKPRSTFVELKLAEPAAAEVTEDPTVVLALDGYAAHVVVDNATDLTLLKRMLKTLC